MAQQSFNNKPYFDDFDPENNFYRILFKPGYAVQARELNQLQSILQHQITGISNHLFKKNTIVIPGGIALNESADIVLLDRSGQYGITEPAVLVGKTITNAPNFDIFDSSSLDGYITAIVLGYRNATIAEPAALYVKYINGQTNGVSTFQTSEVLKTVDQSIISIQTDASVGSTIGKVATLSKGLFYTRELFVDCPSQSVIVEISRQTVSNCVIGLNVIDSIVTSDEDQSLLDNAIGSPNQYAPGADRYKVELVLTVKNTVSEVPDDRFIKLMVLENSVITYLNNKTEYAEIMKRLAQRTYDANGNFIVNGLNVACNESDDSNYIWAHVGKGKCYLGGYEYEQIVTRSLALDKPRDEAHRMEVLGSKKFAEDLPYVNVAGGIWAKEIPEQFSLVELLNATPNTVGVQSIGYAIFRDIQYVFGGINSQDVYRMFFDSIIFNKGYSSEDLGGIRQITKNQGVAVLHALTLTNITGTLGNTNIIQSATTPSQEGTLYTLLNNTAYLIKTSATKPIPSTDVILDTTTKGTSQRISTFVTNYTPDLRPLIEIDVDPILTLRNGTVEYYTVAKNIFNSLAVGENLSPSLSTGEEYEQYSYTNYIAYNADGEVFVDLSGLFVHNGSQYTINIPSGSPLEGVELHVYATIKTTANNISGSTAVETEIITTPSSSWMSLKHGEVTEIMKVVDGLTVDVVDVTYDSPHAVISTSEDHGLNLNDTIVVADVRSSGNTNGTYDLGYNGIASVAEIVSSTEFKITIASGGNYVSGGHIKLPVNINSPRDITNRFIIDRNQNSNFVHTSLIKLRKGSTPPSGQIAIQYRRQSYSSTGNYVSVDSYGDYTTGDLNYIGKIGSIVDSFSQTTPLRSLLDFRTRTSSYFFRNVGTIASGSATVVLRDLNISNFRALLIGKYVVGPGCTNGAQVLAVTFNPLTGNSELVLSMSLATTTHQGTFYIGLVGTDLSIADVSNNGRVFTYPKYNTKIEYDYIKFTPKHIMVFINRVDDVLTLEYKEVSSVKDVYNIRRDAFMLPLLYVYMKPYTVDVSDVSILRFDNPVYQMLDIHELKLRLDRNDYYTSLALNRDIAEDVADAQLEISSSISERGFWNENLIDLSTQAYTSNDFACTIYDRSFIAPGTVTRTIPLAIDPSMNTASWVQRGFSLMLPYEEQVAYTNTQASKFNNLNPFNMVNWTNGKLTLSPHVDNWIDVTVEPVTPVVNNITNVTNNTTNNITNTSVTNVSNITNVTNNNITNNTINNVTNVTNNNITNNNITKVTNVTNVVPPPVVATAPAVVVPPPPVEEIVTQINNLKTSWGKDSAGGYHAITFDWVTNLGRTGRVNTDKHLSQIIKAKGVNGYNGVTANSMINRKYNDSDVKQYLFAGTHFDQKAPNKW